MKVYKHPEYDDHYVVIGIDEDMTNPREFDQLGTFITYNKRYSPDIYGGDFRDIVKMLYGSTHIEEDKYEVISNGVKYIVLPVYIYQHSCITYSTCSFNGRAHQAEWDSGLAGLIYATEDDIKEWYLEDELSDEIIDKVLQEFESECEEYTKWCNVEFLRWDEYSFEDGVFEHIDGAGGYWYEEAITDDLGLADDFEEYHSIEALELELRRTEANRYFTE